MLLAYANDGSYHICGLRQAKHHLLRLCQPRFFIKGLFLLKFWTFQFFWLANHWTSILVPPAYIFWKNMFLEKCTPAVLKKVFKKLKGFFDFFKKKDKNNDFLTKISVLNSFLGYFATLANLSHLNNTKIELSQSPNLVIPLFKKRL